MRYRIYTGTMLAAMFLFGSAVSALTMESKSGDTGRTIQKQEEIHAVDENAHFEVNQESVRPAALDRASGSRTTDLQAMPPSVTSEKGKEVVESDHDFVLHP